MKNAQIFHRKQDKTGRKASNPHTGWTWTTRFAFFALKNILIDSGNSSWFKISVDSLIFFSSIRVKLWQSGWSQKQQHTCEGPGFGHEPVSGFRRAPQRFLLISQRHILDSPCSLDHRGVTLWSKWAAGFPRRVRETYAGEWRGQWGAVGRDGQGLDPRRHQTNGYRRPKRAN